MNEIVIPALRQLLMQSPILLVYLAGMMFALAVWRRYPVPCVFVLIATTVLLVVSVAQTFLTQYLIHARVERGWEPAQLSWVLSASGLVGSVLRAIGLGLLLAAVFVGRGEKSGHDPASLLR